MDKSITIHEAQREDFFQVRSLIQELADFENMPDGPKINHKDLERDCFDHKPNLFKCVVAKCGEDLVGFAIYFNSFSTSHGKSLHLEDLCVTAKYRDKHIGSSLFNTVAQVAVNEDCHVMKFTVLRWNPATEFYKRKGAVDYTEKENWHMFRFEGNALKNFAAKKIEEDNSIIRDACKEDFQAIRTLLEELYNIRNLTPRSKINLEVLKEEVFDKSYPLCGLFVAEVQNEIVGFVIYYYSYSTWVGNSMTLEDFYVTPKFRGKPVEHNLYHKVVQKAVNEGCKLDFWVTDPNMREFYTSSGAVDLTEKEEWHYFRLEGDALKNLVSKEEDSVIIRTAIREDCESIVNLSREIADYHQHYNFPQVTCEELQRDAFDTLNPFFGFIVAENDKDIIGYAHYYYTYSIRTGRSLYLQDLYITEQFRNKHIGSRLLNALAKKAVDEDCEKLEFLVTSWNQAQNFYKKRGAIDWTEKENWHFYRYDRTALKQIISSRK